MASGIEQRRPADWESPAERPDLLSYLSGFGLTLADLEPHQVAMFVAARNLAEQVEELDLPVASKANGGNDTLAEDGPPVGLTAYERDLDDASLPADEMDVTPIRAVEDMARILPTQWLLEEVWPEAFYAKLAERELLMPEWRQPARDPHGDSGNDLAHELIEACAEDDTARQHAYVLLDTSRSMKDHDRRGLIARGLALAFLRRGHDSRSRLHLRPFTSQVGDLSSGRGDEAFQAIVRRIIDLPHAGQTRIQAALEQAVSDIRSDGPCLRADILLITDGMSRLGAKPLDAERLHTFLVGDLCDVGDSNEAVKTLKAWSRTFRRVWNSRFAEILAPTPADCLAASELLHTLSDDPLGLGHEPATLDRVLANARSLLADLKRALGKRAAAPPELDGVERQLHETEQRLAPARTTSQAAGLHTTDRPGSAGGRRSRGAIGLVKFNPWDYVKRIAAWIWRTIRSFPPAGD
jgi:hypothetical protein